MEDIAIVGMACLFPGARDIGEYWQNIVNKVDSVTDPPCDWAGDFSFDPDSKENDKIYCKRGGYLGDLSRFDPLLYGVMPMAVDGAEPEHFLALRVAYEAMKDAGFPDIPIDRERTEIILGRGTYVNRGYTTLHQHGLFIDQTLHLLRELHPEYTEDKLQFLKQYLKSKLPPFTPQTAPGLVSTIMTGLIANRLDLRGTNYTIDAACASSLIAVESAVQDLLSNKCDAAIAGGVQLTTHHLVLMVFCQLGALSRRYQIRPFDKNADGTLLGEGIGMMVLKRRQNAERDGNRIYALIKAVGSASDGKAKSVIAPRLEGEQLAIRKAYEAANISPSTIELIEAHGTAMPLGDLTEIQALNSIFRSDSRPTKCAIGSVKSMIAHLIPASGMASLIKTALALYHKVLPPTLHCEEPNPQLEIEKTPFYINTETRPWIHGVFDTPRRAGVNAFGFGGINAHAILEEYVDGKDSMTVGYQHTWDTELCVFSGESRGDLIVQSKKVHSFLSSNPNIALKDLAYTINSSMEEKPCRLAIVGTSLNDLANKLAHALDKLQNSACTKIKDRSGIYFFSEPLAEHGNLAFLFPGEGSQYVNMLSDLCIHFPEVRYCFDILDRAFADHPENYLPSGIIFPPPTGKKEERIAQEEKIWLMQGAVDAVITADRALFRLLNLLAIVPQVVVGHSSGEFMALEAAGVIEYADERELVQYIRRGNSVIEKLASFDAIQKTRLIAVGAVERTILSQIVDENKDKIFVAMDNCPNQVVLCSIEELIDRTVEQLKSAGALCQILPFARPYHTPLFEPACELLSDFFHNLRIADPRIKIYSCMTAKPMLSEPDEIRRHAIGQWACRVRFRETIETMYSDGVRMFLEVGPRANLTDFVRDILRGRPHLAVASNVHHRSGITQLNHALGLLAAHGIMMKLDYLYRYRMPRKIDVEDPVKNAAEKKDEMVAPKLPLSLPILGIGIKTNADIIAKMKVQSTSGFSEAANANIPYDANKTHSVGAQETLNSSETQAVATEIKGTKAKLVKEYFHTMEQFLNSQEKIMQAFLRRGTSAGNQGKSCVSSEDSEIQQQKRNTKISSKESDAPCITDLQSGEPDVEEQGNEAASFDPLTEGELIHHMPLIGIITSYSTDQELTAIRRFDFDEDLFLFDHTLGRNISVTDTTLTGLPIMPLTVSMEIMAEAASLLVPGKLLIGMKEIRAYRWITFEENHQTIMVQAKRQSDGEVKVQVWESRDDTALEKPLGIPALEGIMIFGDRYLEPPPAAVFDLQGRRPSRWTKDSLYSEGMFSGPCFQGMTSVDWWGEDGAEATLKVLPPEGFFKSLSKPYFVTDHVLLDAAGQLIAYWIADHRETGFNVYPFRVGALNIYGYKLRSNELVKCRARIEHLAENQLRSHIDVIGPDGRAYMSLVDWDDRSFNLPSSFYRIRFRPKEVLLSATWPESISGLPNVDDLQCCVMRDFQDNLLHDHGKVWLRVLAHLVLSKREREVWRSMRGAQKPRTEWLLARVAAKDAIRLILKKRYDMELCLPDIEIGSDSYGKPIVQGAWVTDMNCVPSVSLSHKQGIGMALASENGFGCGIDLEFLRHCPKEIGKMVFDEEEYRFFTSITALDDIEWPLRIWCAKEAVGKALGRGLQGRPQNLILRELSPETGIVRMEVSGGLLQEFPHLKARTLEAYTMRENDLIIASSIYKEEEVTKKRYEQ
jgi:acyl transferase domain-containing protein/phosphopantetheinyl transferase